MTSKFRVILIMSILNCVYRSVHFAWDTRQDAVVPRSRALNITKQKKSQTYVSLVKGSHGAKRYSCKTISKQNVQHPGFAAGHPRNY